MYDKLSLGTVYQLYGLDKLKLSSTLAGDNTILRDLTSKSASGINSAVRIQLSAFLDPVLNVFMFKINW